MSEQCSTQAVGSELQKQLALQNKSESDDKLQLRNVMLLYNQSTMDLICNKKFTSKINKSIEKLRVCQVPCACPTRAVILTSIGWNHNTSGLTSVQGPANADDQSHPPIISSPH